MNPFETLANPFTAEATPSREQATTDAADILLKEVIDIKPETVLAPEIGEAALSIVQTPPTEQAGWSYDGNAWQRESAAGTEVWQTGNDGGAMLVE